MTDRNSSKSNLPISSSNSCLCNQAQNKEGHIKTSGFSKLLKSYLLIVILGISNILPFAAALAEPKNQDDILIGKTFMDNQVDKMLKKFSKKENPVESLYEGKKTTKETNQTNNKQAKQKLALPIRTNSSQSASSSQKNSKSNESQIKNSKQKNSITIEDAYAPVENEKKATFSKQTSQSSNKASNKKNNNVIAEKEIKATEENVNSSNTTSNLNSDQTFQKQDPSDSEYAQDEVKPQNNSQAVSDTNSSAKASKGEYFNDNEEIVSKQSPEEKAETINEQNSSNANENTKTKLSTEDQKDEDELNQITKGNKKNKKEIIDTINFIQPSLELSQEDMVKVDLALSRAEQEQLTILWRATLERNKTIHFIVEKLTPDDQNKKKNQVLSQILNTAIFLPFYALQAVAPADTSGMASYLGAGLASDLINGKAKKNGDRMQLSQTEMVIMFMMIDQVAERLRNQFHLYKQEKVDEVLAQNEMEDAQREAVAALEIQSPASQFLSQVRVRQIERELRRIRLRMRSNRLILIDLCGTEAVGQVDELMSKEIQALTTL